MNISNKIFYKLINSVIHEMSSMELKNRIAYDKNRKDMLKECLSSKFKKHTISDIHGINAFFNSNNDNLTEFFRHFKRILGYLSEDITGGDDPVKFISGSGITGGSGSWEYGYNDTRIYVEGYYNNKGFLGTDYYITEITSTNDISGFDSPVVKTKLRKDFVYSGK